MHKTQSKAGGILELQTMHQTCGPQEGWVLDSILTLSIPQGEDWTKWLLRAPVLAKKTIILVDLSETYFEQIRATFQGHSSPQKLHAVLFYHSPAFRTIHSCFLPKAKREKGMGSWGYCIPQRENSVTSLAHGALRPILTP